MNARKLKSFRRMVRAFYRRRGRTFPWRETCDPYKILVSEIMLQQTQVGRVLAKYTEFLRAFPDIQTLADAPLGDVLKAWQGMGYNRRAKALHKAARLIVREHSGKIPKSPEALLTLPGIGPSTAGGILAFAYDIGIPFIETNIRRAVIYHFFEKQNRVGDNEVMEIVERTLDRKNPRLWYYALFDYGTYLAQMSENPNRRSSSYARQPKFEGSHRQMRGKVLKYLLENGPGTGSGVAKRMKVPITAAQAVLNELCREGFVVRQNSIYAVLNA